MNNSLVKSSCPKAGMSCSDRSAKDEKEARVCEMEARLSELELEKALNDAELEKDELLQELQAGQRQLAGLAEAFEDLRRNYQGEIKEMKTTANRLDMQLKLAQAELKQARTALKTMEGFDGSASQPMETSEPTPKSLQNKMETLQNLVESLQIKKQASSAMIRRWMAQEGCGAKLAHSKDTTDQPTPRRETLNSRKIGGDAPK
ncbi:hypothetical protein Nmel_006562, partial [Mimus melanotis]